MMFKLLLFSLLAIACSGYAVRPPAVMRWDFNNLDGWQYEHQGDNQCTIKKGVLKIYTRANSSDRKKVRTSDKIYTTGRYTWCTYIPRMGKGDQTSVGSWIYCDDQHEIDFEVGYGKKEVRDTLGAEKNEMIAYMTTQAFPFSSVPVKIKTGWHIFEIDLALVDGKYKVTWLIDGKVKHEIQQDFGKEYSFYIFCSVENLKFIGDHLPSKDNYGLFDYVIYTPHE